MEILHYPVKRATLAEKVYKIHRQSFAVWLRDIGITHRRTLSPADIKKIIAVYGINEEIQIKGL